MGRLETDLRSQCELTLKPITSLKEDLIFRTQNPSGGCGSISDQYVAGLFDGCGKVVTELEQVKGKYEKYPRYRLHIEILNMKITGKVKMSILLNRIKDHVRLKKEEVNLALGFCETIGDGKTPLKNTEHGLRKIVHARFGVLGENK